MAYIFNTGISSTAVRDGHLKIKDGLPISASLQIVADEFNTSSTLQLSTLSAKVDSDFYVSGDVGIGTDTPDRQLQVHEPSSNSCFAKFTNDATGVSGDTGFFVGINSLEEPTLFGYNGKDMVFATNGIEKMRIESGGNVGIGTSSPSVNLDIENSNNVLIDLNTTTANANTTIRFQESDLVKATIGYDGTNDGLIITTGGFTAGNGIFINDSQNVGIGTSSPSFKLDILGSSPFIRINNTAETEGGIIFQDSADTGQSAAIKYDANGNSLIFYNFSFNTERMRIDSSGNVGIGTSSPTARLEISSPNQGDVYLEGGTDNSRQLRFSTFANISDHAGHLINASSTNGAIAFATGGSEAMRINSNQDVGIGTSSPSRKLHVSEAVNGDIALFTNTIDADLNINLSSGVTLLSPSTTTLAFGTSSTERMRIDSSGNLGIGTSSPSGKLQIYSDADVTYSSSTFPNDLILSRINTSGNNQVVGINFQCTGNTGTTTGNAAISAVQTGLLSSADLVFQNRDNGVRIETMRIASDGKVGIGTSSPNRELTVNGEIEATNLVLTNALYVGGTAASNALDDYEEGTWTPVLTGSTTAPTGFVANFLSGSYTKIGRQVVARFGVNVNNVGTGGTGTLRVTGLPFVGANIGAYQEPTAPANGGRWVTAANAGNVYAFVVNGQSYMDFRTMASNSDTALTYSELQGGSASVGTWFTMVVTYFV